MKRNPVIYTALSLVLSATLAGCGAQASSTAAVTEAAASSSTETSVIEPSTSSAETTQASVSEASAWTSPYDGYLDTADFFTDRDLEQDPDLTSATRLTLADGKDITITEEGVYVISGTAANATIYVEADDTAKVQIVLDGVTITNESMPAIYVKSADKVFVTVTGENSLSVTGTFATDGTTNLNAVVYSREDLAINGTGSLSIASTAKGISSKDDLKITGGTYTITSTDHALDANDSIRIAGGTFTLQSSADGIHASNDEDDTKGYIYIADGSFTINAASDGIQGISAMQIDGGTFTINAAEGLEATIVQINDGSTTISATDDGINASNKSSISTPYIEINGGELNVAMGQGDTDALDANGSIYINGGTVNINAQFAFDFDAEAELNGGTVYVNGEQVTEITESMMMGGGMMGGMGGPGGQGGPMGGGMGGPGGRR